jgi:hypothetical protein
LFVGGSFNVSGGQTRYDVAAVDVTSGQVLSWDPPPISETHSIVLSGSTTFVGGVGQSGGVYGYDHRGLVAITPVDPILHDDFESHF